MSNSNTSDDVWIEENFGNGVLAWSHVMRSKDEKLALVSVSYLETQDKKLQDMEILCNQVNNLKQEMDILTSEVKKPREESFRMSREAEKNKEELKILLSLVQTHVSSADILNGLGEIPSDLKSKIICDIIPKDSRRKIAIGHLPKKHRTTK